MTCDSGAIEQRDGKPTQARETQTGIKRETPCEINRDDEANDKGNDEANETCETRTRSKQCEMGGARAGRHPWKYQLAGSSKPAQAETISAFWACKPLESLTFAQ